MLAERISEISRSVSELARIEPVARAGGIVEPGADADGAVEPETPVEGIFESDARADGPFGSDARAHGHFESDAHAGGAFAAEAPAESVVDPTLGAAIVDEHTERAATPIAIRDARRDQDATPWGAVVQRRLDRYLSDRERFVVLLVELLDAERLRLAQSPLDSERQVREIEAAMVQELRPADALVREADGRYWLIAPDTDASAARALAGRIAAAARRSASHRGVPLKVAVGIAVCPEHGLEAGSLLGHAEVDLYAAQASGRVINDPDGDSAA